MLGTVLIGLTVAIVALLTVAIAVAMYRVLGLRDSIKGTLIYTAVLVVLAAVTVLVILAVHLLSGRR